MRRILFCQLSCPLVLSEVALSESFERVLPKFKFENIFVTSHDTAVVWVYDDEEAVELVKKGNYWRAFLDIASFFSVLLVTKILKNSHITFCRMHQPGRIFHSIILIRSEWTIKIYWNRVMWFPAYLSDIRDHQVNCSRCSSFPSKPKRISQLLYPCSCSCCLLSI